MQAFQNRFCKSCSCKSTGEVLTNFAEDFGLYILKYSGRRLYQYNEDDFFIQGLLINKFSN